MNHKKVFITACVAIAAVAGAGTALGQVSASPARFSSLASGYMERARTMAQEGNYAGVIDQLRHLSTEGVALTAEQQEESVYLLADAYYQRGDKECLDLLRSFIRQFPASTLATDAGLKIGDYYFFHHDWAEALAQYTEMDLDRLNRDQYLLYSYRLGLCQIKTGHFAEAGITLQVLKNVPQYKNAYTFYSAYLEYIKGDYDKAYTLFNQVKGGEHGLDAAYYIAQIDYTRGRYEEVATKGAQLLSGLQAENMELAPELNRITGLSLFKLNQMSKARGYLTRYVDTTPDNPAADAVYALGVCDYEDGDYTRAAERLSTLTEGNDAIAQSAWLYLGQCDMKSGNDDVAAMAFEKAARMDFDRNVSEIALYNYVAALTRGGKVPFSSSADMLESFIKLYPNSEYTPLVEGYLAAAYYNDRDYAKALQNIEKIKRPSKDVLSIKQKVLYQLGVDSFTNGRAQDAVKYLQRSLELASHDRTLAVQTRLWLGDALYSTGAFAKAESNYAAFVQEAKPSENRTLALYNEAYAIYQQDKYAKGATAFEKALAATPSLPETLKADAYIRLGDCLYYSGNYQKAQTAYQNAISMGVGEVDYAAYRHAVMRGLAGDVKGKIVELDGISKNYKDSKWVPNALMEMALTYEAMDQNGKAAETFNYLATSYPQSSQARKAKLNLALTYMKAGNKAQAADIYKDIIKTWPSSEEADMANTDLKKYYASTGALSEYAAFLKSVPGAKQLDADQMEQLAFDAAETSYAENQDNIALLQTYIKDYPNGKYLAQALMDVAYSLQSKGRYNDAEEMLSKLIAERPHSVQYPEALLMKAEILEKNLQGRTDDALATYLLLEKSDNRDFMADAYAGVARTANDPEMKLQYARKARMAGGVSAEVADEMRLVEAEVLLQGRGEKEAIEILESLASNPSSLSGAKGAVMLGEYYINRKEYGNAEKEMLKFIELGTPHQFQLAKGFIILADAYKGENKTYLAKEYMQSLKENYPGNEPEILNAVNSRLKSYK